MKRTLSILAVSLLLVACGNSDKPSDSTAASSAPATVANSQNNNLPTYIVGSQLTYPPFHYQDERGEPIGFEMELLKAVAHAGGFNIQVQNTPRKALEKTLDDGSIQIWSSTISIVPERSEKMDFSEPFMHHDRESIYILDNDANKSIQKPEQLKDKKIAINEFSRTGKETVEKLTGSALNAIVTKSYHLSMKDLYTGKVDGVLDNDLVLINYIKNQTNAPATRRLSVKDENKEYAFAVKKGNKELLDKINKGLETIKADGTYQKLVHKWFGDINI